MTHVTVAKYRRTCVPPVAPTTAARAMLTPVLRVVLRLAHLSLIVCALRPETTPFPLAAGAFVEAGLAQGANMAFRRETVVALGGSCSGPVVARRHGRRAAEA